MEEYSFSLYNQLKIISLIKYYDQGKKKQTSTLLTHIAYECKVKMQPGVALILTALSSSEGVKVLPCSTQQLPCTYSAAQLLERLVLAADIIVGQSTWDQNATYYTHVV